MLLHFLNFYFVSDQKVLFHLCQVNQSFEWRLCRQRIDALQHESQCFHIVVGDGCIDGFKILLT